MNRTTAAIFIAFVSGAALALDPLAYDHATMPRTAEGLLANVLRFHTGWLWADGLNSQVKVFGNEKVGEKIVEFVDGAFDAGRVSPIGSPEYQLCSSGLEALGYIKATNSLSFVKWAALHGNEGLRWVALRSCAEITEYGDEYFEFLDRALREGVITRYDYATEASNSYLVLKAGRIKNTPERKLKIVLRLINNPTRVFLFGSRNDDILLADLPSYTNSVERLAALSAFLDNENTPPEGHTKYDSELARLKALPPENLVRVTDELEARLAELKRAAERKRKIAQVKKYAVPAGGVVLAAVVVCAVAWRRRK